MENIFKNPDFWVVAFLVAGLVVGLPTLPQSFANVDERCHMDSVGNIVCEQYGGAALSIYDVDPGQCLVEDHYFAKCRQTEGSKTVTHARYFGDTGWPVSAPSCMGWMDAHGCDGSSCKLLSLNGVAGECKGSVSDNKAECYYDSHCRDGYYCSGLGQCMPQVDKCSWRYRCEGGVISGCTSDRGIYGVGSGCYFFTGVHACKGGASTVVGNTVEDVCGTAGAKGSITEKDCSDFQVFVDGYCVSAKTEEEKTLVKTNYEVFTSKIERLKQGAADCEAKGGVWTGTNCAEPKTVSRYKETLPNEGDACVADYIVSCENSVSDEVVLFECVDGLYVETGEECEYKQDELLDVTPPKLMGVSSYFDDNPVAGYLLVFAGAGLIVSGYFSGKKRGWW